MVAVGEMKTKKKIKLFRRVSIKIYFYVVFINDEWVFTRGFICFADAEMSK